MGTPFITDIQFQQLDNETVVLNCSSTGGPASETFWTRNCIQIQSDESHIFSKVLVDSESATYENTLQITGECVGLYQCIVTNPRGAAIANYSCGGNDAHDAACNS